MSIVNDEITKYALEKIEFYTRVSQCDHTWTEIARYPSPIEPICRIRYKCDKCGCYTGESISWSFDDHLTYMKAKRGEEKS